jgi:hypothetical protein
MKKLLKDQFYKRELKNEIRILIVVTIGFTIAFSWRQTIFDMSLAFINAIFKHPH